MFESGWRWSDAIKPIAGTDDVAVIPAGHDAWTVGGEPCVTVSEYEAVVLGSCIYVGRWLESARETFAGRLDPDDLGFTERIVAGVDQPGNEWVTTAPVRRSLRSTESP